MQLDLSCVNPSKIDAKRGLILPNVMTTDLAEDVGIMIGDGSLRFLKRPTATDYEICCYGNLYQEKQYHLEHIRKLKYKLFGLLFNYRERPSISTCELRIHSKGLFEFYTKVIGLPFGPKQNIGIPNIMFSDKKLLAACLRGIADTDFSLVFKRKDRNKPYYPTISLDSYSKQLVVDCKRALKILGVSTTTSYDLTRTDKRSGNKTITHSIATNGVNNLSKWIATIGFSSPKNKYKYNFWLKHSYGPSQEHLINALS